MSNVIRQAARPAVLLSRQLSTPAVAAYKEALNGVPQTRITTLPNGLRVATEQTSHKTATIGLTVNSGSRAETAQNNGVAHFLEHMIFKGTEKRSQAAIEEEVENIGAHLNAYTARDHTVYHSKCLSKDVDRVTELLADIFLNSKFDAKKVEAERSVILREAQEVASIPEEVVFDYLHQTAYQGSSLGRTILGPEENIKAIKSEDIKAFIQNHYTADRIVLTATGGVDHDALVKLAEQYFGKLPAKSTIYQPEKPTFVGSDLRHRDDAIPEAHVAIAVEGVGLTHPDFFPLLVASTLIGNWDQSISTGRHFSSKLAETCASNHFAHRFSSFLTSYADTGLWGAYGVVPRDHIDDFLFELQAEWMHICSGPKDSQVQRAKTALRGNLLFSVDGTTPVFEEIGRQILVHGRRITPAEIEASINAVTTSAVRDAAMKYIYDKCPAVVGYGSTEAMPDYNRIRSSMFWLRM